METSASSGRTIRLFHRISIVTIDAIEHVFNVVNSYLAIRFHSAGLLHISIGGDLTVAEKSVTKIVNNEREDFGLSNAAKKYIYKHLSQLKLQLDK
jgi:hypothetical protein